MRKSSNFASGETIGLPISSSPETGNSALNSAPNSIIKLGLHGNKSCFSAYADLNIPISLRSQAFLRSAPWRLYFYFVFDFFIRNTAAKKLPSNGILMHALAVSKYCSGCKKCYQIKLK